MIDEQTRQLQYDERRKFVKRTKIGIIAGLVLLITSFLIAGNKTYRGAELDPSAYVSVRYQGYDGKAQAKVDIDYTGLKERLQSVYSEYEASLFPLEKKNSPDDFDALLQTFECRINRSEDLGNGDELIIKPLWDEDMAKELKLRFKYDRLPITVDGLSEGIPVTKEMVFSDFSISINGISPVVTLECKNESENEFVKTLDYEIKPDLEFYKGGDVLKIRAKYDEEAAVRSHYAVEEGAMETELVIPGDIRYVDSAGDIDEKTLRAAVKRAEECFVDANEWGLRIFTEAHLPYSWEGTGDYTFEWSNPRLLTAYVEKVKNDYRSDAAKPYNYLELAFEVHISQSDGVGCDAEAVVCFDSLTVDKDAQVDINPDSAQLFAASYLDKNIKNTLRGWFGDYYSLDRIDLRGMDDL